LHGKWQTQTQSNILEWVGSAALEAGARKGPSEEDGSSFGGDFH
jgi:hypothetical protein